MEYTCFEGMPLPVSFLMDERSSAMNVNSASSSADSTLLLESFHTQQQQQLNPNYYYNPQQFNFPAVSWSTTDPTLLTDPEQKQPEELLTNRGSGYSLKLSCDTNGDDDMGVQASCYAELSGYATVQLHQSRSSTDLHHHAGLNESAAIADQIGLHVDPMIDGRSSRRGNTISSRSSASSMDPFSFCGAGGGGGSGSGVNASSQSHWMQQMCSLPSDQYQTCVDALMMPKLISDPFSDSPQQQQRQQQPPFTYYMTSSTSVNCLHDADSCGSSDRDRSTISEEIAWVDNHNSGNNSDIIQQQQGGGGCTALPDSRGSGGESMVGLMLSSVELPDEYSSSIAAAADDVELLDHVRQHHHRSTCGSTTTAAECAAVPPPSGRVSWMSPGTGNSVRKSNHATTLDPLLLLGSAAATASPTQQQDLQLISNNLLPVATRSVLGPFKPQQPRAYTLDSLPTRVPPLSFSTPQNCIGSSMISPRYRSHYASLPPLINNAGPADNHTSSSSSGSFYKDFHTFSNRPQHQGVLAAPSSSVEAAAGGARAREFNLGGDGFESRREFGSDQLPLLSASRKPNATSIEPQSVAARHRRKKISERVRILEKLIPRGNKMDTASMLDEAIEYVKFLQLQVQLLESMGEPEPLNTHSNTTALATTSTTMTTTTSSNNNNNGAFPFHHSKVDSNALIAGAFGSSHHLSRSEALMQKVTIAAAAAGATKSTTSSPLILSEVLQEQLFKQKLCLVSLRQYCPQQQARRSS